MSLSQVQRVQQVQPPEKFSYQKTGKDGFDASFDKASEESQVNTLIYTVGTVADDIVGSLGITETEQKYDIVKQKFEDFFKLGHNKEEGNIRAGQV